MPRPYVTRQSVAVEWGPWYFSFFYDPRVWCIGGHWKARCCKLWLCFGPFEVNRMWKEEELPDDDEAQE